MVDILLKKGKNTSMSKLKNKTKLNKNWSTVWLIKYKDPGADPGFGQGEGPRF